MAPLRVSTTKSEWLPDDPTAFVPTRLWKLPFITTWDDSRNQNRPTDSAEEAFFLCFLTSPCHNKPGSSRSGCQRSRLVPPISRGQTGLPGTGPAPTPIQGFGNWPEPQDGPFSCQEDHCRPPRHFPWSALRCSTVIW